MSRVTIPGKNPSSRRWWAALLMIASPALTQAATQGELWENTSTMQGPTGRMELGSQRDCHPLHWLDDNAFEPKTEGGCRSDDFRRLDDGFTWVISCEDGRRGTSTVHRLDADRVDTDLDMETPDGRFLLHVESRRVGACSDPERND